MENNKTGVNHEARKGGTRGRVKENEATLAKHETGPTHAQLVRMTLRRGYTTVSQTVPSRLKEHNVTPNMGR